MTNLLATVVGALPEGFVLLLGLGAAGWLARRSRPAAITLATGLLVYGLYLVLKIGVLPAILGAYESGMLEVEALQLSMSVASLVFSAVQAAGVIVIFVAVCLGPAPLQFEEVEP